MRGADGDSPITGVAFSPDSRLVLSVSPSGVFVWDARRVRLVAVLRGVNGAEIEDAAFSPDAATSPPRRTAA